MSRYNPFKPGSIVAPGMFSGRGAEILALERCLFQAKHGNARHFLITGERGIGKSSLLFYVQLVATGEIESTDDQLFSLISLNIELEPHDTYADIIYKVGSALRGAVAQKDPATHVAKSAWDFLKRWEVMGVKYNESREKPKPSELLEELTISFTKTLSDFGSGIDGILLLIDEADKAPGAANLGGFVKLFTERLTKQSSNNVIIGLAGLPMVIGSLRESHESSLRIFQTFSLDPLAPSERERVLDTGMTQASAKSDTEIIMTDEAKAEISELSEGYPHFLQQFAYSAFETDTDNVIDIEDVRTGASHPETGAIQELGTKYFHELYYERIGSDEYRGVLRAMAEHLDGWVTKTKLRQVLQIKEATLANALTALKKKQIILSKPGVVGTYRLPTKAFAVWIRALTKAEYGQGTITHTPDKPAEGKGP